MGANNIDVVKMNENALSYELFLIKNTTSTKSEFVRPHLNFSWHQKPGKVILHCGILFSSSLCTYA